MKKFIDMVAEFHTAFNMPDPQDYKQLTQEQYELRHRLLDEENREYLEACDADDLVGIADALGDQLYIIYGTILKHGLQDRIEEVFAEIHRSNMSKLDKNGKPILREDGKILKGENYFKPDIKKILGV
jgi:predicted HAD superfamily Cof-like phosphohydrolase